MFKKIESLGNLVQMTKSDIKALKKSVLYSFPLLEPYLDDILPKAKSDTAVYCMKLKNNDKAQLYFVESLPIFFKIGKNTIPTLKVLHRYPHVMKKVCVDTGAIKFLLGGADMMAPGLISEGGWLPGIGKAFTGSHDLRVIFPRETEKQNKDIAENNTEEQKDEDEESGEEETDFVKEFGPDTKLTKDTIVSVYAQGKAFALAIGVMEMDSEEIEKTKTGLAVKIYTFVGDELFSLNLNN